MLAGTICSHLCERRNCSQSSTRSAPASSRGEALARRAQIQLVCPSTPGTGVQALSIPLPLVLGIGHNAAGYVALALHGYQKGQTFHLWKKQFALSLRMRSLVGSWLHTQLVYYFHCWLIWVQILALLLSGYGTGANDLTSLRCHSFICNMELILTFQGIGKDSLI